MKLSVKASEKTGLRYIMVFFIAICFTFPSLISTPAKALSVDLDESGVIIKRDCDNSKDDDVLLDDSYDVAVKGLYTPMSFTGIDGVQLFIYGIASGTSNTVYSHQIKIGTNTINFRAKEVFSSSSYGWALFSPSLDWFTVNTQCIITVRDINSDTTHENLNVGIDKSFFSNQYISMPDYQRSAWSHDFTGSNWPDPWVCSGELMIKLVFFKDQRWRSYSSYTMANSVQINSNNDYCWQEIYVDQADLSASTRAQLYIYGYGYGYSAPNNQKLYIQFNDDEIAYINTYDLFQENNWGYGIIDMISTQWLHGNSYNKFKLGKMGTDTSSENMVIGIDDQGDTGYAAWMQDGSVSTIGGIMMGLELFDADQTTPLKETQVTGIEYYDWEIDLPYFKDAAEEFSYWGNYWGYTNINPQYDNNVRQADFYHQRYNNQDRADSADLIYHAGHGSYSPHSTIMTYRHNANNEMDPDDKTFFQFADPGNHNCVISEAEYDSDGWDTDPEWVWYTSCDVLKGVASGTSNDNEMQTLLYHGTHFLFGYHNIVYNNNHIVDAAFDFWYNTYFDDLYVKSAFITANEDNDIYCWAYYYHTANHHDYLWGFQTGPTFDCVDRIIGFVTA